MRGPHASSASTALAVATTYHRNRQKVHTRLPGVLPHDQHQQHPRQAGQRPKSDRLAPKVLALVAQGRAYRLIGRELGLSKNTVADIVRRNRSAPIS